MAKYTSKLDKAGMTASVLCAIHCAAVPLLITFLPFASLGFLANPIIEWGMIILALCIGCFAIGLSYLKTHHRPLPLILLVAGFLVIITGHLLLTGLREAIIVPMGGLIIAIAHFFNFKLCSIFNPVSHLNHTHPIK